MTSRVALIFAQSLFYKRMTCLTLYEFLHRGNARAILTRIVPESADSDDFVIKRGPLKYVEGIGSV